jgi:hypothetical protein
MRMWRFRDAYTRYIHRYARNRKREGDEREREMEPHRKQNEKFLAST